jgi:PII-like signaling protein
LRAEGLAGATVLKGQAGFGYDREVHTVAIEVAAVGLPIVLEVVDTEARIEAVLPKLDDLLAGGVVTVERVRVIRYAGPPPIA